MTELIVSMTETQFARRPTCAKILSNIDNYTMVIVELKIPLELKSMTEKLLANVPDDSIIHEYLDQVLPKKFRRINVVLLGSSGVGKSELLLRLTGNSFDPLMQATIGGN